jgi:hypothetical protein
MYNHIIQKSLPALDLLKFSVSNSYFNAREHEVFYTALKKVEARREFHAKLIEVCTTFLTLTSNEKDRALVDELISRGFRKDTTRARNEELASDAQRRNEQLSVEMQRHIEQLAADVQRQHPRGYDLLDLTAPLTLEGLKTAYRTAALKHHPDQGGRHEDMISINHAYAELHPLILDAQSVLEEQFAPEADPEYVAMPEDPGTRVRNCLDYRYVMARLLLSVHLDDWALDQAFEYLQLLSSEASAETPYTRNRWRHIELIPNAAKLAERLALAKLRQEAEVSLRVATRGVQTAQNEGLRFENFVRKAELTISGVKRANFVINHSRQAENALRLGIIDQKRYEKLAAKFASQRQAKNAGEAVQAALFTAYAKSPGFLPGLPPDALSVGKSSSQHLVPEPDYHVTRLAELTEDQQAEYAAAFGPEPVLQWARKYIFVRLHSLVETAILYDRGVGLDAIEREARVLSRLRGDTSSDYYGVAVVDAVRFLSELTPQQSTERLGCLRALHAKSQAGGLGMCSVRLTPWYFEFLRRPIAELRGFAGLARTTAC